MSKKLSSFVKKLPKIEDDIHVEKLKQKANNQIKKHLNSKS